MKKLICFFAMLVAGCSLFAFDRSLNGSWGLIQGGGKEEIVRFNTNEITLMGQLLKANEYEEAPNSVYISNFGGETVIMQYYPLSPNALLFILWNADDSSESITLILSRL